MANPNALAGAGTLALLAGMALVSAIIGIIVYLYFAFALFTIARKLKEPNAWLAWIPIANLYLLWKMSGTPTWTIIAAAIGYLLSAIPFIGWLLALFAGVLTIWWFWKIVERRGYPGWISILMIVPVVNLVVVGVVAWAKK